MSTTPTPEAPSPELLRMHNAGQLLANCAFNIAQHAGEPVSESVAATLKQCQSEWDAACLAFKTARAALTQGAGEAVEPVAFEVRTLGRQGASEWQACTKDLYEDTLRTGLYAGWPNAPAAEVRALVPAQQLQQAVARALAPIQQAIRDYHYALDTRQNGDLAQSSAFNEISQHLGMHWQQGKEAAIRLKGTHD